MEPSRNQFFKVACAFFMLTACSTQNSQHTWTKASVGHVEQEKASAESECLARSYEVVNSPAMPSNSCVGTCINNNSGFSSSFMAGAAARQNREAREARERVFESCMVGKGWQKQSM